MTARTMTGFAAAGLASLGMARAMSLATAQTSTAIIAPSAPPPPRMRSVPAPPSTLMMRHLGHWRRQAGGYVWGAGHWIG